MTPKKLPSDSRKKNVLIVLLLMLILLLSFHLLFPLLGISLVISATIWGVAIATIFLICVATMLFFLFSGVGIFILGLIVLGWTLIAIILFPLLFPIVIPVLLLMLLIGLISRGNK